MHPITEYLPFVCVANSHSVQFLVCAIHMEHQAVQEEDFKHYQCHHRGERCCGSLAHFYNAVRGRSVLHFGKLGHRVDLLHGNYSYHLCPALLYLLQDHVLSGTRKIINLGNRT